jgi:hypothetical protein
MMHPTKEELDRVWNTGPIYWLRDFSKGCKGKKPYRVTCIPYITQKTVFAEYEASAVVWATSKEKAYDWHVDQELRRQVTENMPEDLWPNLCYEKHVEPLT